MRLELHCHSTCSDGSLAPEEVAAQAGSYGVELFCLTDHDTMVGYERTREALPQARVLRGLELSCKHRGRTIHLLTWGVEEGPGCEALERRLLEVRDLRRERLLAICERLATLGVHLDVDAILAQTEHSTPGRPDVAKALVAAGVCTSMREAFDRYLHDDGPAYVSVDGVTLEEGLALGRAAGARMGLAHPQTLRHHALVRELFQELREAGLEGIEAYYGGVSPAKAQPWLRLADELGLVVTGGSDFHGDAVPHVSAPGIDLPARHSERLRAWLGM